MMDRWPHQISGVADVQAALHAGAKRICLVSPTGGGKTTIATDLIRAWRDEGLEVSLYTHRRMLLEQTRRVLEAANIEFGIRAAGHEPALLLPVQLCMTPTEGSRVYAAGSRELHKCQRALIDEAHCQTGGVMERIMGDIVGNGGSFVGLTATPLDIQNYYDELVVAGCTSSLRRCGALLPCYTYGPDEPDLRDIKSYRIGEDLTEKDNAKAIMRPGVFGRVYDNWKRLNPDAKPTILFGPDVAGSIFFAEEFTRRGVEAAHIDGESIWYKGESRPSTDDARNDLKERSAAGELKVVCNRFVMREGVDWPHLYCGIFATVFGSLSSFLQSGGRLLRYHPSLDHVLCIDHGGNWHRHGSLNSDREWHLGDTNKSMADERKRRLTSKEEPEPICCPKCSALRLSGPTCPKCGYTYQKKSRVVIQVDGTLREMKGDIYRPKKVSMKSDTQKQWDRYYWRAKNSKRGMTFAQAEGLFRKEHGYWPPRTLENMPQSECDWDRRVADVPYNDLRKKVQVGCRNIH